MWRVSAKWVQDSKDFNEWMSEEDYEVDANGKRQIHRHRLLVDDLMEKKQPPTKKKHHETKNYLQNRLVSSYLSLGCLLPILKFFYQYVFTARYEHGGQRPKAVQKQFTKDACH